MLKTTLIYTTVENKEVTNQIKYGDSQNCIDITFLVNENEKIYVYGYEQSRDREKTGEKDSK